MAQPSSATGIANGAYAGALTANTINVTGSATQATGLNRPSTGILGLDCAGPVSTTLCAELDASEQLWLFGYSTAGVLTNLSTGQVVSVTNPLVMDFFFANHVTGLVASATDYGPISGYAAEQTAANLVSSPLGRAGVFKTLNAFVNTAPGGSATDTITLYVNGSTTALTCTITGAATTCSDTSDTVTYTSGQSVSYQYVESVGAASTGMGASVEFHNP
jgi:hypothetical protein